MKVLVIGSGGREHAIAWRLALDPNVKVFATPGNPGMKQVGQCVQPNGTSPSDYLKVASDINADLTVVGPEAPLVAGVCDAFLAAGRLVVGPSQAAARLEASKQFAKQVMVSAGIPTARYVSATSLEQAFSALQEFTYPVVLKADGLAAGKGVIIAQDEAEARAALDSLSSTLGPKILIEEFLDGEEASFIVLSDGTNVLPLEASQDHKTIHDNDTGPNTGGMGAYCDGRVLTKHQIQQVMDRIIQPAVTYMRDQGTPFVGFLYAGLMMTEQGAKTLEFNVRLGDPETQSLLHRVKGGFTESLLAAAKGSLNSASLDWHSDPSVCVVMAAAGYPDKPKTGDAIHGIAPAEAEGSVVFQAGTKMDGNELVTSGGRVLGVTASGPNLADAISTAYRAVDEITFQGMQYRKDIGAKGLKRW